MSHLFPIAACARAALTDSPAAARTLAEAQVQCAAPTRLMLATEWLTVASEDVDALIGAADRGPGHGFVQRYEDAAGNSVLAVTFWKVAPALLDPSGTKSYVTRLNETSDHTDDLYFRSLKPRPRRKARPVAPGQLDMFAKTPDEGQ